MQRCLIDTGPLVALFSSKDPLHGACIEQSTRTKAPLFTCWPVVTEACYLLRHYPVAVANLLTACQERIYAILPLAESDIAAINTILAHYADIGADLADACLVHLAQREGIGNIFTLDRRHFYAYRTSEGKPLAVVP